MTFDELTEREPRLTEIRSIVERASTDQRRADGGFCANAVWYGYARPGVRYGDGSIRGHVVQLVGRESIHPDPELRTSQAYQVVYDTFYGMLPPCDHEDRLCGWGH